MARTFTEILVNPDLKARFDDDGKILEFIKSVRRLSFSKTSESNDGFGQRTVSTGSGHFDWKCNSYKVVSLSDAASEDIVKAERLITEALPKIKEREEAKKQESNTQSSAETRKDEFKAIAKSYFDLFPESGKELRYVTGGSTGTLTVSYQEKGSWDLIYLEVETKEELESKISKIFD